MLAIALVDAATSIYVFYTVIEYNKDPANKPMRYKLFFLFCLIKVCNFYCVGKYFYYGRNQNKDKQMSGHEHHEEILYTHSNSIVSHKSIDSQQPIKESDSNRNSEQSNDPTKHVNKTESAPTSLKDEKSLQTIGSHTQNKFINKYNK